MLHPCNPRNPWSKSTHELYENALVIELVARGHTVEQQRQYPVHYRGHFIGQLVPDLIPHWQSLK
ncbi:MAG: GxxExxY protein [Verrucomicrobiales bacterium]|nr:GxxExxY protein [Verrucomicrobiales bacterium]